MEQAHYEQIDSNYEDGILFVVTSFCPGCPGGEGGCEFCPSKICSNQHIEVLEGRTMFKLRYDVAKRLYSTVIGKHDRIKYWYALNDMKGDKK